MSPHSRIEEVTGSLLAVVVGVMGFACLSLLRMRLQPVLNPGALAGLLMTLLTYLLPGVLVGLLAPRYRLAHASALGVLSVGVVWREIPLQRAAMSAPQLAQFVVLMTLFGVAISVAGALAAPWIANLLRRGKREEQH